MRIIFDSKEERDEFFERLAYGSVACPSDIGLNDCDVFGRSCEANCGSCWENALPHEVKEEKE